jgi:hypothetical protein
MASASLVLSSWSSLCLNEDSTAEGHRTHALLKVQQEETILNPSDAAFNSVQQLFSRESALAKVTASCGPHIHTDGAVAKTRNGSLYQVAIHCRRDCHRTTQAPKRVVIAQVHSIIQEVTRISA